ncbi:MAG: hypothetical protein JWP27_2211 [Flaviaesturariibacter sp.]|nr:hypothetical protein [Flaviaesturariibacter sp.]
MPRSSDTGHAKNIATAGHLIEDCRKLATGYRPSNEALKIAALELLYNNALTAHQVADRSVAAFLQATQLRREDFRLAEALSTRVVKAFSASGASPQAMEQIRAAHRRLKGWRKSPVDEAPPAATGKTEPHASRSVSQRSYDMMATNFERLIDVCRQEASYKPEETDLTIAALQATLQRLNAHNMAVPSAESEKMTKIRNRNDVLYKAETGLVDTGNRVKAYAQSLDPKKHPEARALFGRHRFGKIKQGK